MSVLSKDIFCRNAVYQAQPIFIGNKCAIPNMWQTQDDRQLVVTPSSRDGVHSPGQTLVPVICLPRARQEDAVLEEEQLVPWEALLEEVSLPSFVLSAEAVLMEDGVKFLLSLGSNIVIQILITISDILA